MMRMYVITPRGRIHCVIAGEYTFERWLNWTQECVDESCWIVIDGTLATADYDNRLGR